MLSCKRYAQLDCGPVIASVKLTEPRRKTLAALHDVEMGHTLGLLPRVVLHRGVGFHLAADHFEEGNPSGERVGHRLVDEEREGRRVVYLAHHNLILLWIIRAIAIGRCGLHSATGCYRLALHRGRGIDFQEVQQMVGADIAQSADVEHGEESVFADRLVERGDEVLFGDGALAEELLHQFIFAFSDDFNESFVRGLCVVLHRIGNLGYFAAAIAIRRVEIGLHRHQVDYSVKAMLVDDGKL